MVTLKIDKKREKRNTTGAKIDKSNIKKILLLFLEQIRDQTDTNFSQITIHETLIVL